MLNAVNKESLSDSFHFCDTEQHALQVCSTAGESKVDSNLSGDVATSHISAYFGGSDDLFQSSVTRVKIL